VPSFAALKQLAAHATALDGSAVPLHALPRQGLTALAGIAKPLAFFDMLSAAGVSISHRLPLADHQDFDDWINSKEFSTIKRHGIVCTEKDAIKLFPLLRSASNPNVPMLAWSVPLVFTPEPAFFDTLDEKLSSAHGHQTA
jgi:tetraacyldisaccharide 4'-kinase